MSDNHLNHVDIARHRERIESLERWQVAQNGKLDRMETKLELVLSTQQRLEVLERGQERQSVRYASLEEKITSLVDRIEQRTHDRIERSHATLSEDIGNIDKKISGKMEAIERWLMVVMGSLIVSLIMLVLNLVGVA